MNALMAGEKPFYGKLREDPGPKYSCKPQRQKQSVAAAYTLSLKNLAALSRLSFFLLY